jgi:hypothetical protein
MRYWIVGAGLAGWAGIVGLSWWLADERAGLCGHFDNVINDSFRVIGRQFVGDRDCYIRALVIRDGVLTMGLTVALVGLLAVAIVWAMRGRVIRLAARPGERVLAPMRRP